MSVRPHPSKSRREPGKWWYIDIGRGDNRTKQVFHGSFEEAKIIEKNIRQQRPLDVPTVAPKIKDMILPFLDWYKGEASSRTIRDIKFSIDLYFIEWFGNLQPQQLTLQIFNDFKKSLTERRLAPVTINKHLNYFSSLLKWAVNHGHCQELPFRIPRYAKKRTTAAPKQPLTQRQVDAIYRHIEVEYRLPYLLMVDHGLRQEEAMNVKIEDINEGNKTIQVLGKGSKYRVVPFMSHRFVEELCKILSIRFEGPLVVNPKTGKAYVTIWKAIKRAANSSGITRNVNHHLLRHTFSALAAESGMNPHALQRILGHASIETTNQIYTNVSRDFVGDEARILMDKKGR